MIVGVISDTHGNQPLMFKVADILRERLLATHILHLGDDYADKEALEMAGYSVSGVPGLWCREYNDTKTPKRRVETFEGVRVAYAHSEEDLPPLTSDIGLALFGHTHRFGIVRREGIPCMNPGHLKSELDRMRPPTFGLVRITETTVCLAVHDCSGHALMEKAFKRQPA